MRSVSKYKFTSVVLAIVIAPKSSDYSIVLRHTNYFTATFFSITSFINWQTATQTTSVSTLKHTLYETTLKTGQTPSMKELNNNI